MADIAAPESATDDHSESVKVEVLDVGGGFDDAASDEASLLPDQISGAEGVGEEIVVQARDTTEPINRDGTDFVEEVRMRRVPNGPDYSLSLGSLTPAGAGAEHLDDGVGGDGRKAICDGAIGELFNGLVHFLNPNSLVFLYRDADVGVLVEHLVDGDEVLVVLIVTARMQNISPMQCVAVETVRTQSCRRRGQCDPEPFPRDGPRSPWHPWRSRWSGRPIPFASGREYFPSLLSVS